MLTLGYDLHVDDYKLHASEALLYAHMTSAKEPVSTKGVSRRTSHSMRAQRESTQNASKASCRPQECLLRTALVLWSSQIVLDLLQVTTLKMGWCNVGPKDGAKAVADLLMFNSTIATLDLRGNGLGDEGV